MSATIIVGEGEGGEEDDNSHLRPLLYTHAALMAAAFGLLFPVAAYLYYQGVTLGYKILLPIAVIVALSGFVLVVVYVQLTSKDHFDYFIHGVVGVALLVFALLAMPVLLLHKKLRVYHFRLGHVVAFFGMGNILLVSSMISSRQCMLFLTRGCPNLTSLMRWMRGRGDA